MADFEQVPPEPIAREDSDGDYCYCCCSCCYCSHTSHGEYATTRQARIEKAHAERWRFERVLVGIEKTVAAVVVDTAAVVAAVVVVGTWPWPPVLSAVAVARWLLDRIANRCWRC